MEEIYRKIKELRIKSGMTLKELGEKTGLTAGFLSQLERGNSSLAISSLMKIADAFQVNITYFFESRGEESYVVRSKDQKNLKINNLETTYVRINGKFPQRSLAPFILKLVPNQKKKQIFQYPGEEFYYVLKGSVLFTIDNTEYLIHEGDSIHFPAHLEHFGENPTDQETILIGVVTPVIF